jgi:hypothetical protein
MQKPTPPENDPTKREAIRLAERATTTVLAIQCPQCFDIVYSRNRHDMRSCCCGSISIDGGFDYVKLSYDPSKVKLDESPTFKLVVPLTKKEIYDDWNRRKDELGIIRISDCARLRKPRTRHKKPSQPVEQDGLATH